MWERANVLYAHLPITYYLLPTVYGYGLLREAGAVWSLALAVGQRGFDVRLCQFCWEMECVVRDLVNE